jgi:hypothetical protein
MTKICIENGCKKPPLFGLFGGQKLYCGVHKLKDMLNLNSKRCIVDKCYNRPCYNIDGKKPLYCQEHKTDDMICVVKSPCDFENCKEKPLYGQIGGKPTKCRKHRSSSMYDLVSKKCTICEVFQATKKNDNICFYCKPFPRLLKKELKVKTLLEESGYNFDHNKQIGNIRYRPDFLFDCKGYFVVLECDEGQHSSYDDICENIRMDVISDSLVSPTLFIRYNPDLPGVKTKQKHKKLLETLDKHLNQEIAQNPPPIYLFYSS